MKRSLAVAGLIPLLSACEIYYRPDPGPTAGVMPESRVGETEKFRSLAQAIVDAHYTSQPILATGTGMYDYDNRLGGYSRVAFEARAESIRRHQARLLEIDRSALQDYFYHDSLILDGALQARLVEIERIRSWERDPRFYRKIVEEGLTPFLVGAASTVERRMELAAARMSRVPVVLLEEARANLKTPPKLFAEMAVEEFDRVKLLIREQLPKAFEGAKDPEVRARFAELQKPAAEAVDQFVEWLRKDLMPKATGEVALGAETFTSWLKHSEGIEGRIEQFEEQARGMLKAPAEPGGKGEAPHDPRNPVRFAFDSVGVGQLRYLMTEGGEIAPRAARWLAVVEIHGKGATIEGTAALLTKEAGLPADVAMREARQAAAEPFEQLLVPAKAALSDLPWEEVSLHDVVPVSVLRRMVLHQR